MKNKIFKTFKTLKYSKLYWFELDCPDISDFLIVRIFRKVGIDYIPFTLRFCGRLFLREDKSKYSQKLVNYCKRHGVLTYVIQEGAGTSGNLTGCIPLRADYFISLPESKQMWIDNGMPKGQVLTHYPQKKREDYRGIVFLYPLYTVDNFYHPNFWDNTNVIVMETIYNFMKEDVVFKLHPKNQDVVKQFIPKNRIIEGDAIDLIKKYDKIYCFSFCSIAKDCEMLGKKPILIKEEK